MQSNRRQTEKQSATRSGVVVLELILTMPAFLMMMLAIVQISLIYVVNEQAAYASRYAAKIASETASGAAMSALNTGPLQTSVNRVLNAGGVPLGSCRVILEHNVGGPATIIAGGCDCDPPGTPLPSVGGAIVNESVRTTVCVPLDGNIPDFLNSFGFSIQTYIIEQSTTFIYEL